MVVQWLALLPYSKEVQLLDTPLCAEFACCLSLGTPDAIRLIR